jgi:hypothetical protein
MLISASLLTAGTRRETLRKIREEVKIDESRKKWRMHGKKIAFAKSSHSGIVDTIFETDYIIYKHGEQESEWPPFYPALSEGSIHVSSIQHLLGTNDSIQVQFSDNYVRNGFRNGNDQRDVFLKFKQNLDIRFDGMSDKVGGIATPNLKLNGISRSMGPVGIGTGAEDSKKIDKGDYTVNMLDPKEFLGNEAKILGSVLLRKLLPENVAPPSIKTESLPEGPSTTFQWRLSIKGSQSSNIFQPRDNTRLDITAKLSPSNSARDETHRYVSGKLTSFDIYLQHLLKIKFESFEFVSERGNKPFINAAIEPNGVEFLGPLKFVRELQQFIPSELGLGGATIEVGPSGIVAEYSVAIPALGIGIFTLRNVQLTTIVNIPFTGEPISAEFHFSKRENPFQLSVSFLGGTGYFGIIASSEKIIVVAELRFGGFVSFDIAVASGGLEVSVGLFFELDGDKTTFGGILNGCGSLSVLGLVTISAQFCMKLSYSDENGANKVWGEATLSVGIHLLFFKRTVTFTIVREFAQSPPFAFGDLVSEKEWDEYCNAFALEEMTL